MANNCRLNYIVQNYVNRVQKILEVYNCDMNGIRVTSSISGDSVNQILLYEKMVVEILKHTLKFTIFDPVMEFGRKAIKEREGIMCDLESIRKFCNRFRNSPVGIKNYNYNFRSIIKNTIDKQKNIGCNRNLNVYFLNLMGESNNGCVNMLENLSRYRICPQLRLISEYVICLNRREIIKIKDILNLPV